MRPKVKAPTEPTALETGLYALERLREVIRELVSNELTATITLPRSWCGEANNVPLLSPKALKLIDLTAAPDTHFKRAGSFVLELGRKKFAWPAR